MKAVYSFLLAGLTAMLIALHGCGGGSTSSGVSAAGIGGTGKVASGTITGFGSIFVNDIEYEFDANTGFDIDDDTSTSENDLRIGMVVTVTAENVVGSTGTATRVVYDDNVEGPVVNLIDDGTNKLFSVLGISVSVDATTTVFDDSTPGFDFDTLAENHLVEVSGFFDGAGVLNATYIENKGDLNLGTSEVELKGTVVNAPVAGAGVGDSFSIDGVTINIVAETDLAGIPGGLVTDGTFVEAKGVLVSANTIDASKVEVEDAQIGDNADDVSIEGLISDYVDDSNFRVAGQLVNASSAVRDPATLQLEDDLRVKVEGPIVNGTLICEKVEAEDGKIKVNASVSARSVINSTITLTLGRLPSELTVTVNAKTKFKDKTKTVNPLTLADISPGDFLEISAFDDGSGNVIASKVQRNVPNDVILQGPMDDFDTAGRSITVRSVVFATDGSTEYEDAGDNLFADADAFDAAVNNGDSVKIRDRQPGNGVADIIDLEED
jgi:hypothetical protein